MKPSLRAASAASQHRTQRRVLLVATGAILASAALIGVVVAGYVTGDGNGATTAAPAGSGGPAGQPVRTADGPVVKLASWSGGGSMDLGEPGRPTVVLAMAGWCSTCIAPARDLKVVHEEFGDRVNIIAVSVDPGETEETLARFRDAADEPEYLWGFDSEGTFAHAFELRYLDTVIVLDAAGDQLHKSVRPSNDQLLQILATALGESR